MRRRRTARRGISVTGVLGTLVGLVLIVVCGVAVFFDRIESQTGLVEAIASRVIGQPVRIGKLVSSWNGTNPQLLVSEIIVESSTYDTPDLLVRDAAFEINGLSLLRLWPRFEQATIRQAFVRTESLPQGGVKVAGWLIPPREDRELPAGFLQWIGDQSDFYIWDSVVEWRQRQDMAEAYQNINLVYTHREEHRLLEGTVTSSDGDLILRNEFFGNPFQPASDWQGELVLAAVGVSDASSATGFSVSSKDGEGILRVPRVEFTHLRDLLVMAGVLPRLGIWMQQANAQGHVHDLEVRFYGDLLALKSWDVDAQISGVEFAATDTTPSASNLGARIKLGSDGGVIDLKSQDVSVAWPQRIKAGLDISQLAGQLLWSRDNGAIQLKLQNGQILADQGNVTDIELALDLGDEGINGTVDLGFSVPDISVFKDFVPSHMSERVQRWWSHAFPQGELNRGKLSYVGPVSLQALKRNEGQLFAVANAKDVTVDYGRARKWPAVTDGMATVSLRQDTLTIKPQRAKVYNSRYREGEITLTRIFDRSRELVIKGATIDGPASDAVEFLLRGPFLANNPLDLDITASDGEFTTRFDLVLPLAKREDVQVAGTAEIRQADVRLPPGLPANGLNASVEYTQDAVTGSGTTSDFLGGTTSLSLETLKPGRPPELKLTMDGNLIPIYLGPVLGEPLANSLSGETDWLGELYLRSGQVSLHLESDMKGLTIAMPEPVYKNPGADQGLTANVAFGRDGMIDIDFELEGELRGLLSIENRAGKTVFTGGDLVYGDGEPSLSITDRVGLRVDVEEIDLDPWLDYAAWVTDSWPSKGGETASFISALQRAELSTQSLTLFGKTLGRTDMLGFSTNGTHWHINVSGDGIDGEIEAAPAVDAPFYIADLTSLHWPASDAEEELDDDDWKPHEYPIVSIHVDEFRFDGRELGELDIVARPEDNGWNIARLDMTQPALRIMATGLWRENPDGTTQTEFEFRGDTPETGGALRALAMDDFLEDGGLDFEGKASWPGAPSAFSLERMSADYSLSARRGKLIDVDPKAGRLLGIMNVNSLSRRLRLDFSDIFEGGFAFDTLASQGKIADGDLQVGEFIVVGPSAYIQASGRHRRCRRGLRS